MSTDILPSIERVELIGEPLSTAPRVRRRFFGFLQNWRRWVRQQIGRSQAGNNDLADRGADDLLALALLVQFVRDRAPDALPSLDQLPRRQGAFTLGQLCGDLQRAATSAVLQAVVEPTRYADQCIVPASVIERAFWNPITQAS